MRTYKKKTGAKPLTEELLSQARILKDSGMSIRKVAQQLGFDESTVRQRLKKGVGAKKLGRPKIFSEEQELQLLEHCSTMNKRLYGLSFKSLSYLLYHFAELNNIVHPFQKSKMAAGKDFTMSFMTRHKLSLRTARKTSIARTMGFNRGQVNKYFDNLKEVYDKYKFTADRIYNMDETGIQTIPGKIPKIVTPRGQKQVGKAVGGEQGQTVSVACCLSAMGSYVPPFFIFRRKRINTELIKRGPTGCAMAVSDKGYMNSETFILWINHFLKFSKPTEDLPVLLILDNHVSHINLEAVIHAKTNHVIMSSLPPHTSHKTQPLDRFFFKPLKSHYDNIADSWQSSHPGETMKVSDVAELFKTAYERTATVEKATKAFSVTGVFPLDPTVYSEDDFLPSDVTDQAFEDDLNEEDIGLGMIDFPGEEPSQRPSEEATKEKELPTSISPVPGPSHMEDSDSSVEFALVPEPSHIGDPPVALQQVHETDILNTTPVNVPPKVVSPADIIPLPKLAVKRKRNKKGMKSTILTSTPNKQRLEQQVEEKKQFEMEQAKKKEARAKKKVEKEAEKNEARQKRLEKEAQKKEGHARKRLVFASHVSDTSQSDTNMSLHDDSIEEAEDSDEEENAEIGTGDYALVKVYGKKSYRLFVAEVIDQTLDEGWTVRFLKKAEKMIKFLPTSEESVIAEEDVVKKLNRPMLFSTGCFKGMLSFSNNLDEYKNILG